MASAEISSVRKEFSNPKNTLNSSFLKMTILVVDDDSTSLAIISAMLKEWRYEVASVKTPKDALSTLRAHPGIDLVVTDLHMPEMSGIELQKQINREFKLPVIIMSSDDKESVMLESLAGGAVFFIVKPVNPDGLKNVWQYAVAAKKGKSIVIEEIGSIIEGESSSSSSVGKLSNGEIIKSLSSVANNEKNNNNNINNDAERGSKRKASRKGKDGQEQEAASASRKAKKAKVVWTNSLHNQFLEALSHIGLEKAVPKKILEHMNVQGLTRENVASHLQKYRIFLKRVAERSCFSSKALVERFLKSSFASGHPLLLKTAQEYSRLQEMERMRGPAYQQGYGGSIYSAHNAARHGFLLFANQNASSSNSARRQHGYGQSSLLGHQANRRLVSGNMNPLYQHQGNRLGFANGSNLSQNVGFSNGLINASNGLINCANSNQTYRQQNQARPDFCNAGSSSQLGFGSSGLHSASSTLGTGIIGSIGTSQHSSLNPGCINNNSYAGMRLTTDGQLIGMGQPCLSGAFGSMNRTCNEKMNVAAMGNQAFHFIAQGVFSSSGLDGSNQVSPAFTAANQQANTSTLPGLANPGVTDYNSDHLMNNAPNNLDNTTELSQQLGEGYLSDVLLESNKYQFSNQQQDGGDGTQNPEFSIISSMFPEIYPTLDELLNCDFSESLSLEDTGPWSKQALEQVQSDIEKLLNTNIAGDACPLNESNPTKFVQNANQEISERGEQLTDSDPSSIIQVNNAPAEDDSSNDQNWEHDDFLDSLLSFGTHYE